MKPVPALAAGGGETDKISVSETVQPKFVFTVNLKMAGEPVTVILLVANDGVPMVAAPEKTLQSVLLTPSPGLGVAVPVTEKVFPH